MEELVMVGMVGLSRLEPPPDSLNGETGTHSVGRRMGDIIVTTENEELQTLRKPELKLWSRPSPRNPHTSPFYIILRFLIF